MSDHMLNHINVVLAGVRPARRDFLRSVLLKAAAVGGALCLPASEVLAQGGGGGGKGGGGKGGGGNAAAGVAGAGCAKGKGDDT